MRLIKPSYNILSQKGEIDGIYKAIERAGRLAYKSEDKITDTSAKPFVEKLIKAGHLSVLEHGTVYLKLSPSEIHIYHKYRDNPYTKVNIIYSKEPYPVPTYCVSTNYRVLIEHGWLDDLKYLCEPTEHHERRIGVFFNSNIGIMRELFRHRKMSYIQESSRFCNYSNGKFNGELVFILPSWISIKEETYAFTLEIMSKTPIPGYKPGEEIFLNSLLQAEKSYMALIDNGWKPEQARDVLPLATKSEAIVTGFESDWKYIFKMRTSKATAGKPHPDMVALMDPLLDDFHRLFNTVIE